MNAMLIVAIVIAIIGTIPVIIRKKLLKNYLTLLQNNDIKAIKDLMATKLAKICIPPFNREYLLLNAYLKLKDDTLISGGIKYYDELKSDLEDVEYTKNNEDTPYLEFLLSIIYKNMGNESKSKEYKSKALEDSKGTIYESLIHSQN